MGSCDQMMLDSLARQVADQEQQNSHQIRKLAKLHEKLAERKQMVSLNGAIKLLRAYESALEGVRNHRQYVVLIS